MLIDMRASGCPPTISARGEVDTSARQSSSPALGPRVIGYSRRDAADAISAYEWQVELAETGDYELTLRQAEKLAKLYDRPLATLFLPEPPAEESQEALFRRLPGTPAPPWPRSCGNWHDACAIGRTRRSRSTS